MDQISFYWFYSALAQVLGALIGLLGIFAVYALQRIRDQIRMGAELLYKSLKLDTSVHGYFPTDELIRMGDDFVNKYGSSSNIPYVVESLRILKRHKSWVIKHTKRLLSVLIILLAVAILCLPFCNGKTGKISLWLLIFIVELICSVALLVYIDLFIIGAITSPKKWYMGFKKSNSSLEVGTG